MQSPVEAFDPLGTSFDLDYVENGAADAEFPATLVLNETSQPQFADLPVIPTACLSLEKTHGKLRDWRLTPLRANIERVTPNHIIGAVVKVAKGRTSPIASIDPATRRIRTISGSVYELGAPDKEFLSDSPEVLHCMGF